MKMSITELIEKNLGGAPLEKTAAAQPTARAASAAVADDTNEAEKIASVLEMLVSSNAIEKIAARRSTDTDENAPTPKGTVNTLHTSKGTSHPALRSAAAAAAATKGDKSRQDTPALRLAFKNPPYADPVTGTILKHKVDHRDVNARRLAGVRAELARRKGST